MNKDAKEFRNKYAYNPEKITLPKSDTSDAGKKLAEAMKKRKEFIRSVDQNSEENQK